MHTPDLYRRYVPGTPLFLVGLALILVVIVGLLSLYMDFMSHVFLRLGLSSPTITLALAGIFIGGLINIPLHHSRPSKPQLAEWLTFYERWGEEPFPIGLLRGHTIAINIGGAIVPVLIAVAMAVRLATEPLVFATLIFASLANIFVCFRLGRVVANVGIMLPCWVAPFMGIAGAWLLLPSGSPHYASFAFVAAVLGPFVGADLLNLKNVHRLGTGTLAIGGAGPLDGIVLSGILAAWLA